MREGERESENGAPVSGEKRARERERSVCRRGRKMDGDEELYDEFGNYIGPDLSEDDESESESVGRGGREAASPSQVEDELMTEAEARADQVRQTLSLSLSLLKLQTHSNFRRSTSSFFFWNYLCSSSFFIHLFTLLLHFDVPASRIS